jgi:DHA2 family multidrug resistance protein-like MFS transporter
VSSVSPRRRPDAPAADLATRREWLALAILALPCLVYAMDLTVLNLALPAISADLHPTSTQLLWIVDIYGFMVAGALITMGSLGDRLGGRRILLAGAVAFAAASVLAALATSAAMLIAARAVLGLAGATIAPSTLALIRVLFRDATQRTAAIGIWVASYSAGAAIGPLAGGALLEVAPWGAVFLLAVPVMALVLMLGPRLLPERSEPGAGRLDVASAALASAAVLAAISGLKAAATGGPGVRAVLWVLAGLVMGVLFVRRQRRLAHPLIDLGLFRRPAFAVAVGTNLAAFLVVFGMSVFVAQYLQSVVGLSPLMAGVWSLPEALGFVAGSLLTPALAARVRGPVLVAAGLAVGAAGYLVVAQAQGGLAPVVAGSALGSVGLAAVATLITDLAIGAAPAAEAGAASAASETGAELGGALGIALLGSLGAAVYRAGLPAGVPDGARETIGGALAASERLPGAGGGELAAAARAAFADAMAVTASVSAVVLLVTSVLAFTLLRRAGRPGPAAVPVPELRPACP